MGQLHGVCCLSRFFACLFLAIVCLSAHGSDLSSDSTTTAQIKVSGAVDDPMGATIPNAKVELLDNHGGLITSTVTLLNGQFLLSAAPGDYQLAIMRDGFATITLPLHLHHDSPAPLLIRLKVAEVTQQIDVSSAGSPLSTDPAANKETTTFTAADLKSIPVFDNDYVAAFSVLLDGGDISTGGTTILVDGLEATRVGVAPSAIQSVKINNDPYAAEFYQPGRGQIQITTKPAADAFHGGFNFTFRDAVFDARYPFSPSGPKPPEQRRIYDGNLTGPLFHLKDSSFLFTLKRAEEDLQAVVNATVPTGFLSPNSGYTLTPGTNCPPAVPCEQAQANISAPTRDTEFSIRAARQISPAQTGYIEYQFQKQSNINEGVGDLVLAEAGTNVSDTESDINIHDDYIFSPSKLNQLAVLLELDRFQNENSHQGTRLAVQGAFIGGSAQAQQDKSEYNLRITDAFTYTRGKQQFKFGINVPHFGRRFLRDESLFGGAYTFSSLTGFQAGTPSTYEAQTGRTSFVYHDQEAGIFFQDVIQATPTLTITPGLRYDWNNFTRDSLANFSPRFSIAKALDKDGITVIRAGFGIYYDRAGAQPLVDLKRYERPSLFDVLITQNPCYPVICPSQITSQAPNVVRLDPNIRTPMRFNTSLSVERRVGKAATATATYYNANTYDAYRSVDVNAPLVDCLTPSCDVFNVAPSRPNPAFGRYRQIESSGSARSNSLMLALRGRLGSFFTGSIQYNYGHAIDNTGGINFYPQNQYLPNNEESDANHDARHRLNVFSTFRQGKLLNLGVAIRTSNGLPYTTTTGTDPYGTGFFNARPAGVGRNSEYNPWFRQVDLRYGYDFKLHPTDKDKSPTIGFSLTANNVFNSLNASAVSSVITSPTFGQTIAGFPPRRMQLDLRFAF